MIPNDLTSLANHLWQSTLFAAAVWLLTLALRKNRAAVRHRLWLVASVKFLIPFSLLVSLGSRIPWQPVPAGAAPQISTMVEAIGQPFVESTLQDNAFPAVAPAAPIEPLDEIPLAQPHSRPNRLPLALVSIWIAGFAASMLWWCIRWRRVRQSVRRATALNLDIPNLPVRVMSCPERLEPGVFGIFRPVLLLPEGIRERLSAAQFHCVVAHELCHVRRRDNMAAGIHMFVEALFWFHPLVWWIKLQLIHEQERACDEEVLRVLGDPQVYAESILKICEFYLSSPLICVSGISGSNLKKRIENIMKSRIGVRLSLSRIALLVIAATTSLAGPVAIGSAQSAMALPALIEPIIVAPLQVSGPVVRTAPRNSAIQPGIPEREQAARSSSDIRGSWEITQHTPTGKLQLMLSMPDAPRMSGTSFEDLSTFRIRDLTDAQITSPFRTNAHFEIVRESGTFVCDGYFEAGYGTGEFVLHLDPSFNPQMAALGFTNIADKQFVSMALFEAGTRDLGELRAAGLPVPSFDQLIGMRVLGVTPEFIRSIEQAGFTPRIDDLIGMWANGVTEDFAREMQQIYPSVSLNDLIGMKVQGVTVNFAREMRQSDPSISINDLIGIRIHGVTLGREMRQIDPLRSGAPARSDRSRTWAIQPVVGPGGTVLPDRIQLTFLDSGGRINSSTVVFDPSVFRGLTAAQMTSPIQTAVRFDVVREAGTIVFEGYFNSGHGSGTLVFQLNPDFRGQMSGFGFQDISDNQLFNMAVHDIGPRYAGELRAAGVMVSSAAQLLSMRIQGVTSEYIRDMQQLGFSLDPREWINIRVQGMTPDYVREMRQLFPSASIRELLNMRVQAIWPDYVQEIRQIYPSASVRDVINLKVQAIFPDYLREIRQIYPSASIKDVVNMKIRGVMTRR
jgi:beta-lactamase regulating signal transducer with metallopeptidase domain